MAVVNHTQKFVFFGEPHTASRAISDALCKHSPGTEFVKPHHCKPEALSFNATGYTFISGVRNPFDVLATKWLRGGTKDWTLDRYMDTRWDQVAFTPSMGFCYVSHRIIWYEHLLEDLWNIFQCFELELEHLDKHKTLDKRPWHEYFTEAQFQRFGLRPDVQKYMDAFGYSIQHNGTVNLDPTIRRKHCIGLRTQFEDF